MAILSFADARAYLFAALDVDAINALEAVQQVFDYEPAIAETTGPAIVSVFATGFDPAEWLFLFAVRVYYETKISVPEDAQKGLDVVVDAVDEALAAAGRVGPVNWTIGYADGIDALVAETAVTIGREGF